MSDATGAGGHRPRLVKDVHPEAPPAAVRNDFTLAVVSIPVGPAVVMMAPWWMTVKGVGMWGTVLGEGSEIS